MRSRLAELRSRRTALEADAPLLLALKGRSRSVIAEVEAEERALLAERRRMQPGSTGWLDVTLRTRLDHLRTVALTEPLDPPLVNAVLKSVLTQVVVDWPRSVLVFTWRHGGRSEIGVEMTRRRALSRKHQEPLSLRPLGGALGRPSTAPVFPEPPADRPQRPGPSDVARPTSDVDGTGGLQHRGVQA